MGCHLPCPASRDAHHKVGLWRCPRWAQFHLRDSIYVVPALLLLPPPVPYTLSSFPEDGKTPGVWDSGRIRWLLAINRGAQLADRLSLTGHLGVVAVCSLMQRRPVSLLTCHRRRMALGYQPCSCVQTVPILLLGQSIPESKSPVWKQLPAHRMRIGTGKMVKYTKRIEKSSRP